ncbi:MAG TPA: hypothetical protein ENK43_12550 [Planctomycetes bacterium]|nr:hypothetical protein [Planctomycetota bacterium]
MSQDRPWERVVELLQEGRPVESILSGWQLSAKQLADLVLQAWRAGVNVDPRWLLPARDADAVLQILDERSDLDALGISSLLKGRVASEVIQAVRVLRGEGRGMETAVFNESTFAERFHDDIQGAKRELIFVAPALKGSHWRRWLEPLRRVAAAGGKTAIFAGAISSLVMDTLRDERVPILEKQTHANLVIVDGEILWEGSMNFLTPPIGEEHLRRTRSRLQCDEVRELHDLYL